MYMPPDETVQDLGEINMSFNRSDSAHRGEVRKISTRNPVYDNSGYQWVCSSICIWLSIDFWFCVDCKISWKHVVSFPNPFSCLYDFV